MNLHEYQGKQLFAEYGLPVSKGIAAATAEEAVAAADKIGGDNWVVKAQVHAGGRGKAGGVKLVSSKSEIEAFANQWLGENLVTYQTDANGQPVSKILVETCTDIAQELYLGAVVDRSTRRIVFMASTEGGVEIEKVAEETPEKILKAIEEISERASKEEKSEEPESNIPDGMKRKLLVRDSGVVKVIPFDDIDWVDAAGDYMCVHAGGETHVIRSTLRDLMTKLDDNLFVRIHRSTIVNVERVVSVTPLQKGGSLLHLTQGESLKVSRNYRDSIRKFFN